MIDDFAKYSKMIETSRTSKYKKIKIKDIEERKQQLNIWKENLKEIDSVQNDLDLINQISESKLKPKDLSKRKRKIKKTNKKVEIEEKDKTNENEIENENVHLNELNNLNDLNKLNNLNDFNDLNDFNNNENDENITFDDLEELNEIKEIMEIDELDNFDDFDELNQIEEIEQNTEMNQNEEMNEIDEMNETTQYEPLDELNYQYNFNNQIEMKDNQEIIEINDSDDIQQTNKIQQQNEMKESIENDSNETSDIIEEDQQNENERNDEKVKNEKMKPRKTESQQIKSTIESHHLQPMTFWERKRYSQEGFLLHLLLINGCQISIGNTTYGNLEKFKHLAILEIKHNENILYNFSQHFQEFLFKCVQNGQNVSKQMIWNYIEIILGNTMIDIVKTKFHIYLEILTTPSKNPTFYPLRKIIYSMGTGKEQMNAEKILENGKQFYDSLKQIVNEYGNISINYSLFSSLVLEMKQKTLEDMIFSKIENEEIFTFVFLLSILLNKGCSFEIKKENNENNQIQTFQLISISHQNEILYHYSNLLNLSYLSNSKEMKDFKEKNTQKLINKMLIQIVIQRFHVNLEIEDVEINNQIIEIDSEDDETQMSSINSNSFNGSFNQKQQLQRIVKYSDNQTTMNHIEIMKFSLNFNNCLIRLLQNDEILKLDLNSYSKMCLNQMNKIPNQQ